MTPYGSLDVFFSAAQTDTNGQRLDFHIGNGEDHGLRTPKENFFSKILNFWAWADKLG